MELYSCWIPLPLPYSISVQRLTCMPMFIYCTRANFCLRAMEDVMCLHALIYATSAIAPAKLLSQLNPGCSYNHASMQDLDPIKNKVSELQHLDS